MAHTKPATGEGLALIVVDMQPGLLRVADPEGRVTERCRFALEAARLFDFPLIFTEQAPDKLGSTIEALRAVAPDGYIMPKTAFSALSAPGMVDLLETNQIEHVILCGIEGSICIYQTALALLQRDLNVTILSDAIGGRRAEDTEQVVSFLTTRTKAVVLPLEAVFYAMLGSARHPCFREFTRLTTAYSGSGAAAPAKHTSGSLPTRRIQKRD